MYVNIYVYIHISNIYIYIHMYVCIHWCTGLEPDDDVPDISIDPDTGMLSVVNTSQTTVKAFILTLGHTVCVAKTHTMYICFIEG